ncbi:hypothetical protein [Parachitinimonas caeni]|uniref:Uncharacterized protein n=1 Tax=Parachitinimonas caeni TaxID=3031301 RepID=A0ABT7DWT1_9NEIS|nr:hypothetical protein [Parachitinimonas caeni]MDK2123625.1 hypothetical protein [Parachitinimonas caeni]
MNRVRRSALTNAFLPLAAGVICLGAQAADLSACPPAGPASGIPTKARVVLLGELTGTYESPRFVLKAGCEWLKAGRPWLLTLDFPPTEQTPLDTYLASPGEPADVSRLFNNQHWLVNDGRASVAVMELIEAVRRLKRGGAAVQVLAVGGTEEESVKRIKQALQADKEVAALVVTTPPRASRKLGNGWNPKYEPVGYLLAEFKPLAYRMSYQSGFMWACQDKGCGAYYQPGGDVTEPAGQYGVLKQAQIEPFGYDGIYFIGTMTAAPPVRMRVPANFN